MHATSVLSYSLSYFVVIMFNSLRASNLVVCTDIPCTCLAYCGSSCILNSVCQPLLADQNTCPNNCVIGRPKLQVSSNDYHLTSCERALWNNFMVSVINTALRRRGWLSAIHRSRLVIRIDWLCNERVSSNRCWWRLHRPRGRGNGVGNHLHLCRS